jgi:hypothetical protein
MLINLRSSIVAFSLLSISLSLVAAVNCIPFPPPIGPTLEGTWSGTITADGLKAVSNMGPADINDPQAALYSKETEFQVTFAADGTPDKLLFFAPPVDSFQLDVVEMPTLAEGETATVTVYERNYNVTATEASYAPDHMRVVLDVQLAFERTQVTNTSWSEIDGTSAGTQTIEATPAEGGSSVSWTHALSGTSQVHAVHHLRNQETIVEAQNWEAFQVDAAGTLATPATDTE